MITFLKQIGDNLDYDIDFSDFLSDGDTVASATAAYTPETDAADTTLTLGATSVDSVTNLVKQWLSGGTDGNSYKVTVTTTTTAGRVKETDFRIKIRNV